MTLEFKYPATESTEGTYTLSINNVANIVKSYTGKNQIQSIRHIENPSLTPIYIAMGYSPISISISGYFNSSTTLENLIRILPDDCLFVNTSTYSEFAEDTYWEVESLGTERSIGYNGTIKYSLTLIKQEHIDTR